MEEEGKSSYMICWCVSTSRIYDATMQRMRNIFLFQPCHTCIWNNKTTFCDMLGITWRRRLFSSNAAEPALPTILLHLLKKCCAIFVGIIPLLCVCVCLLSTSSYNKTCLAALCVVDLFSLCHWAISAKYCTYAIFKIIFFEWTQRPRWRPRRRQPWRHIMNGGWVN